MGVPPATNAGDRYNPPGTNPFVMTQHDPFSTFAVDVDTASYDIFRRDVNLGMVPQPAGVRLEEYVNAFAYDYAAPDGERGDPVPRSRWRAAAQVFDRPSVLLRVGVQARKPPPYQKRPANLVFLVDVSGSMARARQAAARPRADAPGAGGAGPRGPGLDRDLRRATPGSGWDRPP